MHVFPLGTCGEVCLFLTFVPGKLDAISSDKYR